MNAQPLGGLDSDLPSCSFPEKREKTQRRHVTPQAPGRAFDYHFTLWSMGLGGDIKNSLMTQDSYYDIDS